MNPRPLLAIVALAAALVSCTHAPPIVPPLETCGGKIVSSANVVRIEHDLATFKTGGEADLIEFAVDEGWPFVSCLVVWYEQNGTAPQKAAAAKFKAGHVEARAGEVSFTIRRARGFDAEPTPFIEGDSAVSVTITRAISDSRLPYGATVRGCPDDLHTLTPWADGAVCVANVQAIPITVWRNLHAIPIEAFALRTTGDWI